MNAHSRNKSWWGEASRIELQHFADLDELLEAEAEAIRIEKPPHNTLGTGRRRSSMKPRRNARGEGTLFQRADGIWVGRVELRCHRDGRRRQREVSSKSYAEAVRKFEALKATVAADPELRPFGQTLR
jgi:hypothetical protein